MQYIWIFFIHISSKLLFPSRNFIYLTEINTVRKEFFFPERADKWLIKQTFTWGRGSKFNVLSQLLFDQQLASLKGNIYIYLSRFVVGTKFRRDYRVIWLVSSFHLWNVIFSDTINVKVVFSDSFHRQPCQMPQGTVLF